MNGESLRRWPRDGEESNAISTNIQHAGGEAFGSGCGVASDRFRRSIKLVPNLKQCKDAVGLAMGQSNGYPDDQSANEWTDEASLQGALGAAKHFTDGVSGRHLDSIQNDVNVHN